MLAPNSTTAPAVVQLKASDKAGGKSTFKQRVKQGLMPQTLDMIELHEDMKPELPLRSANSRGKASPLLAGIASPIVSGNMGISPLFSGNKSGNKSGFTPFTGKDRSDMVFAETPLWCGAPHPFSEYMPKLEMQKERLIDERSTNDRSTSESQSSADYNGHSGIKPDDKTPKWPFNSSLKLDDMRSKWPAEAAETTPFEMPQQQVQYVPVPMPMGVPPGRDGTMAGMWNAMEQFNQQNNAPMMIPVPVPVPVPMGSTDASAFHASMAAAAGQDLYSAFLSSYSRVPPAPQPQMQPPAGFVAPPGYKIVPAPKQDMPYPGSWPSINMNLGRQDSPFGGENNHTVPDIDMVKRPAPPKASRPNNGKNGKGKVFVGGLNPVTTVDNVRDHFSKFGKLIDCSVIKDPVTKLSRGFGFVEFEGGIPPQLLEFEHVIDKRKCGVKPYTYEAS